MMKSFRALSLLALAAACFAQSDRGTLTGTVSDVSGSLIPNAQVVAINPANGAEFRTETTDTGSYTITSVPAGVYNILVEVSGFKKFEQKGVRVQVAQTSRIDVQMQIGATTDSVTITGDAALLRTESAEQSTTVGREQLNQLPLNFAIGAGAVRNPLSFATLAPGSSISGWNTIKVNGAPTGTFKIIFEGQDSTSGLDPRVSDESQPSVEALEEFTLQTSNYSAEFGQAGGGLFNFTARSGTNQFHGSVYDYFAHEKLYAGRPFTNNGTGGLVRPQLRRHDLGASIGGPITLPKIYNGRNRSFFFFNFEMFRDESINYYGFGTVPTDAYRNGDFSAALTGRNLGTDGLGRPILENTIYDPTTNFTGPDGRTYRNPYPNNVIPRSQLDPVALKIQDLIPRATGAGLVNNIERRAPYRKIQDIPSIKIDHNINDLSKMSFYFSRQRTDKDNGQDGLPDPISARRDQIIRSTTVRINYDRTITPTLLLHAGVGYQRYHNPDSAPASITDFDAAGQLGLRGGFDTGFPRFTGTGGMLGGMGLDFGPTNRSLYNQDKPNAIASVTYIRGNHSYKFGGEWKFENFTNFSAGGVAGNFAFSAAQTGLPALVGVNLGGGNVGFNYASFLLGAANTASVSNPQDPQYRRYAVGSFAQDTWKVSRKLTIDYGLRYDYQPAPHELNYRTSGFAPTLANPSAGGRLGATIYEGTGAGRCNCKLSKTYPWAFAPRLGVAYQLNSKTVLRAGWGLSYGQTTAFTYIGGGNSLGMGFNTINFSNPTPGEAALNLRNGLQYNTADLLVASYDPGIRPQAGQTNSPPNLIDQNAGRPSRTMSYNISIQRELTKDMVFEVAYVGNRGAWYRADGLNEYNGNSLQRLAGFGLNPAVPADLTLLTSSIASAAVIARGFTKPYAAFPNTATLAQALRPYPQFGNLTSLWAPLGNNWYDSLQTKVTKRMSYGLNFTAAYTWSKTLTTVEDQNGTTAPINDVYNRSTIKSYSNGDQPHVFVTGINYEVQKFTSNKFIRNILGGWTIGGIFRYASGLPIRTPVANNSLNSVLLRSTGNNGNVNRVSGQPLFAKDLNCHCFDPSKDFVLNPAAWSDPLPGQYGTAASYYGDYRYARRPDEQMSLGRVFRVREKYAFSVRAEMFNIFNRTYLNNPDSGNALATQTRNTAGAIVSGFGRVNTGSTFLPPRSGQIVARIQF